MSQLTISVVVYNHSLNDIGPTIQSVFDLAMPFKLVIIDNSSKSTLREQLCGLPVTYIFLNNNVGYGAAHNVEIRKSIEDNVKYHLVLNPDVRFKPGTLERLVEFMDTHIDVGNVMPKVFYPDGSIQYLCKLLPTPYDWIGRRFFSLTKNVKKRNQLFELQFTGYNKTMNVPYLSGCFMFLRVDALRKVGSFDGKIFMYGEDADLCRRLIHGGYKTVFYPEVCIMHEFQKGSHKSFRLLRIGIESAIYYFNKWGWFYDHDRNKINDKVLHELGYYQSDLKNR